MVSSSWGFVKIMQRVGYYDSFKNSGIGLKKPIIEDLVLLPSRYNPLLSRANLMAIVTSHTYLGILT